MNRWMGSLCLLWWLGGCVLPDHQAFVEERMEACGRDFTCPNGQSCLYGFCVPLEYDAQLCTPACVSAYEACNSSRRCEPRYASLTLSPAHGGIVDGGTLEVRADLQERTPFAPHYPATLNFRVEQQDGGSRSGTMTRRGDGGLYGTAWVPPGPGEFVLTASHPSDGGPRSTARITVDTTPPVFEFVVRSPTSRAPAEGFTYTDPALPTAWRRDQAATIEVRTNELNLDPSSLLVVLSGNSGVESAVGVTRLAVGEDCDARFCGVAQVKLWEPSFPSFNGALNLRVRGRDKAGNPGSATGQVQVTRWKWSYDTGAPITAAPAVGNTGTLYVGTTNSGNTDGGMVALAPSGRVLWSSNAGAVVASPTVGELLPDDTERVYAAHKKGSLQRVGFYLGNGNLITPCPDFNSSTTWIQSALAFADIAAGDTSETVYGVYNGRNSGTLFALRPEAGQVAQRQCPLMSGVGDVLAPGSLLATGSSVVMASSSGQLKAHALNSTGIWSAAATWERTLGTTGLMSLAASNGRVFVGSNEGSSGKLSMAVLDGGTSLTSIATSSAAWNASVGGYPTTPQVLVGLDSKDMLLLEGADGGTRRISTPGNTIKGAPVWGAAGYLYTASATTGEIQARSTLDTIAWRFESGTPIEASMNLDCNRRSDGSVVSGVPTGVLYAANQNGKVFALIVDSPGLAPTAPWPRYQHDARNTGNPDIPIALCQ